MNRPRINVSLMLAWCIQLYSIQPATFVDCTCQQMILVLSFFLLRIVFCASLSRLSYFFIWIGCCLESLKMIPQRKRNALDYLMPPSKTAIKVILYTLLYGPLSNFPTCPSCYRSWIALLSVNTDNGYLDCAPVFCKQVLRELYNRRFEHTSYIHRLHPHEFWVTLMEKWWKKINFISQC